MILRFIAIKNGKVMAPVAVVYMHDLTPQSFLTMDFSGPISLDGLAHMIQNDKHGSYTSTNESMLLSHTVCQRLISMQKTKTDGTVYAVEVVANEP